MTENEKNARIFKALCDPNRLTVLGLLRSGEKCACHLLEELEIGQPTLSHHMRILCDSGIVQSRKEGKWSYYSFNPRGVEFAKELLDTLTTLNADASASKC
ncbi:MAG: ArsR/SmtB family transcription factor [Christensenellales bacterium]|jgi:ArsR family transcriptional regulator